MKKTGKAPAPAKKTFGTSTSYAAPAKTSPSVGGKGKK